LIKVVISTRQALEMLIIPKSKSSNVTLMVIAIFTVLETVFSYIFSHKQK